MNFDSFIRRYVNTCRFVKLVCFCFEKNLKKYIYVCIIEICFLKLLHGEIVIFRPLTNIYYSCSSPLLSSDLLCLIDQTWLRCVKPMLANPSYLFCLYGLPSVVNLSSFHFLRMLAHIMARGFHPFV